MAGRTGRPGSIGPIRPMSPRPVSWSSPALLPSMTGSHRSHPSHPSHPSHADSRRLVHLIDGPGSFLLTSNNGPHLEAVKGSWKWQRAFHQWDGLGRMGPMRPMGHRWQGSGRRGGDGTAWDSWDSLGRMGRRLESGRGRTGRRGNGWPGERVAGRTGGRENGWPGERVAGRTGGRENRSRYARYTHIRPVLPSSGTRHGLLSSCLLSSVFCLLPSENPKLQIANSISRAVMPKLGTPCGKASFFLS